MADAAPAQARGTAFGVFNLISGVAYFIASGAAGLIWDAAGPAATFKVGAAVAAAALVGLVLVVRKGRNQTG